MSSILVNLHPAKSAADHLSRPAYLRHELVPEELNADYQPRSPMQKGPLTTREVFLELISQRLAQGFQLIITGATEDGFGREDSGPAMTSSFTGTLPGTKQRV